MECKMEPLGNACFLAFPVRLLLSITIAGNIATPPWMGCWVITGLPAAFSFQYPFIHLAAKFFV